MLVTEKFIPSPEIELHALKIKTLKSLINENNVFIPTSRFYLLV